MLSSFRLNAFEENYKKKYFSKYFVEDCPQAMAMKYTELVDGSNHLSLILGGNIPYKNYVLQLNLLIGNWESSILGGSERFAYDL